MKKSYFKSYNSDASRLKGDVVDVVHPKNISEVRTAVLRNEKIVIRGAGTGLAGGCVPQGDVVMDLSKMIKISNFDKERKTIEVEAGVVLDDLQDFLKESRLEFPIKPSSHAVATIGGMIATNAVGNRGVKYGRTSKWVRWVEVMSSNGEVEKKGITEMSDYVGMEGITGVVVRACLKLSPIKKRSASLVRLNSLEEVVALVGKFKMRQDVCAIEFLDKMISWHVGFSLIKDGSEEAESSYHLIIEYESDEGKLKGDDYDKVMEMRDRAYPEVAGKGYTRIEDPKVMLNRFSELMRWLEAKGIPAFGHIGIGIIHPCFNVEQEKLIPEMMKLVKRLGGQVSGEHGIGLLKRGFVEVNDQKILRNVKKRCDSLGKFNCGKVI